MKDNTVNDQVKMSDVQKEQSVTISTEAAMAVASMWRQDDDDLDAVDDIDDLFVLD